jgi:hypothetical protein
VDDFRSGLDPVVRRVAEAARKRIVGVVPHATERVRLGWRLIGYNAPAYFAYISFERDHVRIGFEWGVMLPDPASLLQGHGAQVRCVVVRTAQDLQFATPGTARVKRGPGRAPLSSCATFAPPDCTCHLMTQPRSASARGASTSRGCVAEIGARRDARRSTGSRRGRRSSPCPRAPRTRRHRLPIEARQSFFDDAGLRRAEGHDVARARHADPTGPIVNRRVRS